MITKEKKVQLIEEGKKELEAAKVLLFADFEGSQVEELRELRKTLKNAGAKFKVLKKRLLRLVLQEKGIEFDPLKFEGQVGTIFSSGEISAIVQPVYKFSKEHPNFKLMGGLNVETKEEVPFETIKMIGSLPSREILLAQLLGAMIAPLRGLMYILSEKSKRSAE
ncbi:MAG: 50S ribosomal protein L10 [Candidatus Colwellbacteria bacterium]|nr:50S ribosomal protein L10 [Candidatus Colwellbacteria bacterium]